MEKVFRSEDAFLCWKTSENEKTEKKNRANVSLGSEPILQKLRGVMWLDRAYLEI